MEAAPRQRCSSSGAGCMRAKYTPRRAAYQRYGAAQAHVTPVAAPVGLAACVHARPLLGDVDTAFAFMRGAGAPAEGSDQYKLLNDAMIVTVQGVAAGMQNTG